MKKTYPVSAWKTYTVVLFGAFCFLTSGYYLLALSEILPSLIKVSNKLPLRDWWPQGVGLWLICGILALAVWPTVAIAQECHEVLKARLLKKLFG
ncbi:hypothetical protein LH427_09610 [Laribacter hongkongensis]|uniref:hypothetical protein n=1 Tax=Laribacter hongkongensis TaxID=168471 RepID=UPI001EFCC9E9|nr:hypothetical protein [Laribacter hongkongensis]MCG8993228.1 hypothetical protein [Laribacter hongkongensis]MCG8997953.1 hypothetical protein [Laribacter hongkongensis]MCG9002336.1 hypothetical protein [Laribacter hongkongensis]MCG9005646.1 hypothetical protein [Laribacter hongkongensis]MCG9008783.1 hypothetical protein [Laribacter hongkongensis]